MLRLKSKGSSCLIIIALLSISLSMLLLPNHVRGNPPGWFDPSWTKRKPITIANTSPNNLIDYQVKVDVGSVSSMKTDFSDLRFTDSDGATLISYWIKSYTASVSAIVWVKVPSVLGSSAKTIWMYYGNPAAADGSNGPATFEFFDDFETEYASPWEDKQVTPMPRADCSAAVYNGKLYLFGGYNPSRNRNKQNLPIRPFNRFLDSESRHANSSMGVPSG